MDALDMLTSVVGFFLAASYAVFLLNGECPVREFAKIGLRSRGEAPCFNMLRSCKTRRPFGLALDLEADDHTTSV